MKTLILALGFVLIFEGLLPFAAPKVYQQLVQQIASLAPSQIRTYGLVSVLIGLIVVWVAG